jgi:heme-degrading monooxygenase HmoA
MEMTRYTYVWEFRIKSESRPAFERAYGPKGAWAALFKHSPGYIETLLLKDSKDPTRYLTVDRWYSAEAHAAFHREFARQYAALDQQCAGFTLHEQLLGEFDETV